MIWLSHILKYCSEKDTSAIAQEPTFLATETVLLCGGCFPQVCQWGHGVVEKPNALAMSCGQKSGTVSCLASKDWGGVCVCAMVSFVSSSQRVHKKVSVK